MNDHPQRRICGVILAAGSGSRMGAETKQLLIIDGKPLLQHAIDNASSSALDQLKIVLGYRAEEILGGIHPGTAQVIINHAYRAGQSRSLVAVVHLVDPDTDALLVMMGDQPEVTSSIINRLLDVYRRQAPQLVVPRYQGQRGNPVIIDRSLFPELLDLTGDSGARAIFDDHRSAIEFVDFDFPAPQDIDTQHDLEVVTGQLAALREIPSGAEPSD